MTHWETGGETSQHWFVRTSLKLQRRCVRTKVLKSTHATRRQLFLSLPYLHLLVDLPLHGVRRFSAAFVFRRSPLLHLWHSPASLWAGPESPDLRFCASAREGCVISGAAESESCHSLWQRLSFRPSQSLIWWLRTIRVSHWTCVCAPGWRLRRRTISALSSPPPSSVRLQTVGATSGWCLRGEIHLSNVILNIKISYSRLIIFQRKCNWWHSLTSSHTLNLFYVNFLIFIFDSRDV